MKFLTITALFALALAPFASANDGAQLYWSDGDSGRFGDLKFRLANVDAPETGSLKQRGGAK